MKDKMFIDIWKNRIFRALLFPLAIVAVYGLLFIFYPGKISLAVENSISIVIAVLLPICLVFVLMLLLNYFLRPSHVIRFIGDGAGLKGVLFSTIAGIISVGPIYAWYPLLKDLREKGANNSYIAIFLENRAIKPFLLPVMISYFGWIYVLVLNVFVILGSIITGAFVGLCTRKEKPMPR